MKRKSGVSLIVITIAVIVMTTISAVVVVSMKNANHIEYANKVALYSDLKTAKLELSNYISKAELENPYFDPSKINASGEELIEYMPNLKNEYKNIIQIKEGKMYVKEETLKYYQIMELSELGIPSIALEEVYTKLRNDLIAIRDEFIRLKEGSEFLGGITMAGEFLPNYIPILKEKPDYTYKVQIINGEFKLIEGKFTDEELDAIKDLNIPVAPLVEQ